MPPVGFEPTISAGERPQTYALDRAATGTGIKITIILQNTQLVYVSGVTGPPSHQRTVVQNSLCVPCGGSVRQKYVRGQKYVRVGVV